MIGTIAFILIELALAEQCVEDNRHKGDVQIVSFPTAGRVRLAVADRLVIRGLGQVQGSFSP